jgi:hypothetical protein
VKPYIDKYNAAMDAEKKTTIKELVNEEFMIGDQKGAIADPMAIITNCH